ncbi:hypothetical protein ACFL54_03715 [Planctomycetota bacterium]
MPPRQATADEDKSAFEPININAIYQEPTRTDITPPDLSKQIHFAGITLEPGEETGEGEFADLSDGELMQKLSGEVASSEEQQTQKEDNKGSEFISNLEKQRFFARIVTESNLVSRDDMTEFFEEYGKRLREEFIGELLVESGLLPESRMNYLLLRKFKIMNIDLQLYEILPSVLDIIDGTTARKECVLPVDVVGNVLTLAVHHPFNSKQFLRLEEYTQKSIRPVYCHKEQVEEYIEVYYPTGSAIMHLGGLDLDEDLILPDKSQKKITDLPLTVATEPEIPGGLEAGVEDTADGIPQEEIPEEPPPSKSAMPMESEPTTGSDSPFISDTEFTEISTTHSSVARSTTVVNGDDLADAPAADIVSSWKTLKSTPPPQAPKKKAKEQAQVPARPGSVHALPISEKAFLHRQKMRTSSVSQRWIESYKTSKQVRPTRISDEEFRAIFGDDHFSREPG